MDEPFEIEHNGAKAGRNPMFGEWRERFDIKPISYAAGAEQRSVFRKEIQSRLKNEFFYTGEVRVDIVLHLDIQTVLETDATADLDNYAKAILDSLKGPNGILLDDNQVQALLIYYLDSYGTEKSCFDVVISGSPDEFLSKTVEFYEMSDGLWYPISNRSWEQAETVPHSVEGRFMELTLLEGFASFGKEARHTLRRSGESKVRAYQISRYFATSARGFHNSRIDERFKRYSKAIWNASYLEWKKENADKARKIEEATEGLMSAFRRVVEKR